MHYKISTKSLPGTAIYTNQTLSFYDIVVHGLTNPLIWKCPTKHLIEFYNTHISTNHLDIGVGTGHLLDRVEFTADTHPIHLLLADLNINGIRFASRRIKRYKPEAIILDILQPLPIMPGKFKSIGINYVLHCLPGNIYQKECVFQHIKPLLHENGTIFGTTLLADRLSDHFPAQYLANIYNRIGAFSNRNDTRKGLEEILASTFPKWSVQEIGCVAFFTAQRTK